MLLLLWLLMSYVCEMMKHFIKESKGISATAKLMIDAFSIVHTGSSTLVEPRSSEKIAGKVQ